MSAKQVIVLRKDLNMRKGKMVAQGSHAAVHVILDQGRISRGELIIPLKGDLADWLEGGCKKICVGVNSEQELIEVFQRAKAKGLPAALIRDAGHTEFHGEPTLTAVAIGPAREELIDAITGELTLL